MASDLPLRRALLSVSDKTGLVALAQALTALNIEILSTGGTARLLREQHIPVIDVSTYTGFPEMMDGRVKTLHPKIFAGILGRSWQDADVMRIHAIQPIDLVVVNLYPFAQVIEDPVHTFAEAIEHIDIGGPAMLRAAAKNYQETLVIVDPNDYPPLIEYLNSTQNMDDHTRLQFARKAFAHTAQYDAVIANYLSGLNAEERKQEFPQTLTLQFHKKQDLRYGENPHQKAAFYRVANTETHAAGIAQAQQIQGKALSYNNIVDADSALNCVRGLTLPACVIVKHANPCGAAQDADLLKAYQHAFNTDPVSAFGGIIAFNQRVEASLIQQILQQQFVELIIAPEFSAQAIEAAAQKPNVRLLAAAYPQNKPPARELKTVAGGLLVQDTDDGRLTAQDLRCVTRRQPDAQQTQDLLFAWHIAKFVKSNAIVYAGNGRTLGIGAGQMSRIDSTKIAQIKAQNANLQITGSVMASDAFFPFRDNVDEAAQAGVTAIIQPGGSIRDEEVIQAADAADIAMVFTGIRHFRH